MNDLREKLLGRIHGQRLPGLELPPGGVFPCYDGLSLCNVPGSICAWLQAPALGKPLLKTVTAGLQKHYRHVILVLADALGLRQFEQALAEEAAGRAEAVWQPLLEHATLAALTSIVPSTTTAALTSLWTGLPTAGHAMTGYEIWLKDYSMIINAITHTPAVFNSDPGGLRRAGFVPEGFLTVPTLGGHLAGQGVQSFAYHHTSIHRSSLSTMLQPGTRAVAYRTLSDLWLTLESTLTGLQGERSYHYVYYGDLDDLMHRYGPGDERVSQELACFGRGLARFAARLRGHGDTLLLLAADHGQVDSTPAPRYDLHNVRELLDSLVMLPSGEPRLAYLYAKPGKMDRIPEIIEAAWPGEFSLYASAQALAAGLLGAPVSAAARERTGDWIAAGRGNAYLWWSGRENTMRGRHGGLSEAEMLVPLVMLEG